MMFSFNFDQIMKSNIINTGVNIIFAIIIFLIFYTIGKILLNKIKYVKPNKKDKNKPVKNLVIPKPNEEYNREFSLLYREFVANFVFYKPRNIVSGDYYWIKEIDGLIYIAVVDCTGHGVPGAFMSLISSNILNEAVELNLTLHNPVEKTNQAKTYY